jgi:YD repeat-containing protein
VIDERGSITQFTRDSDNRVTQISYPDGGTESFTDNNFGEVTSHRLQNGGIWTYNYDARE